MQILLSHNTTHYTQYYDNVRVKSDNPLYSSITLDFSNLEDGEYTLSLYDNQNELLAKELVRIGDYQIKEYKSEKKYTTYARR